MMTYIKTAIEAHLKEAPIDGVYLDLHGAENSVVALQHHT